MIFFPRTFVCCCVRSKCFFFRRVEAVLCRECPISATLCTMHSMLYNVKDGANRMSSRAPCIFLHTHIYMYSTIYMLILYMRSFFHLYEQFVCSQQKRTFTLCYKYDMLFRCCRCCCWCCCFSSKTIYTLFVFRVCIHIDYVLWCLWLCVIILVYMDALSTYTRNPSSTLCYIMSLWLLLRLPSSVLFR